MGKGDFTMLVARHALCAVTAWSCIDAQIFTRCQSGSNYDHGKSNPSLRIMHTTFELVIAVWTK